MEQSALEATVFLETAEIDELAMEIRAAFEGKPRNLVPMLQWTQKKLGYLPENALLEISSYTGLPPASVFGVVTFYTQFRLKPIGKYIIKVCRGTACHVSASSQLLDDLQTYLRIKPGETTDDRLFTLETVACFGSCALAPVLVIGESVYGLVNPAKARTLIEELRKREAETCAKEQTLENK